VSAYPFLDKVEPPKFLTALSVAQIATGAIVVLPAIPNKIAGAALTAFRRRSGRAIPAHAGPA
jgi:hypothetical protein